MFTVKELAFKYLSLLQNNPTVDDYAPVPESINLISKRIIQRVVLSLKKCDIQRALTLLDREQAALNHQQVGPLGATWIGVQHELPAHETAILHQLLALLRELILTFAASE